uniref:Uncharacterized protein n=1 Tax=Anguilla anguilla TaxID=7936 RepID=A0A0E9UH36_ANGAN
MNAVSLFKDLEKSIN